mgnify:CR=1 FL=1
MEALSLKKILKDYLEGTNFKEINETISINKIWEEVVGEPISKNTKIISYKKQTLIIKASNPVWRNELSLQKNNLLENLQKKINKKIKTIKII